MKIIIVIGLIFFNACRTIPQSSNNMAIINSLHIYQDFQERGYTTTGAYIHFDEMNKEGIEQIIIQDERKKKIEKILNRAEKKKHYQTKFGTHNIFCEIIFAESIGSHKVVITSSGTVYNILGEVKEERAVITDLSKKIDYKITNPEDLKWLSKFVEHLRFQVKKNNP